MSFWQHRFYLRFFFLAELLPSTRSFSCSTKGAVGTPGLLLTVERFLAFRLFHRFSCNGLAVLPLPRGWRSVSSKSKSSSDEPLNPQKTFTLTSNRPSGRYYQSFHQPNADQQHQIVAAHSAEICTVTIDAVQLDVQRNRSQSRWQSRHPSITDMVLHVFTFQPVVHFT